MTHIIKMCRGCVVFRYISLLFIFGAAFSLLGTTYCYGESAPIFYTIKVACVRDDIALHVNVGDSVTDPVGKHNIGTVTGVEYHTSKRESYSLEKNEMVMSTLDGYSDVYITVSAKAVSDGDFTRIGTYRLYVGKSMPLRLPDFCGNGVCVDIGGRHNVKG